MPDYTPTAEQNEALRLALTGESVKIEAGAGSGKTSTLLLIAEELGRLGRSVQYIAFNKPIVEETKGKLARLNLRRAWAHTAHGLAFREVGKNFKHRLGGNRMKSTELAQRLRTEQIVVEVEGERKVLSSTFLAGHVMQALWRFCQSADPAPHARHVPFIPTIDEEGSYANNDRVAAALLPFVRTAWADVQNVNGVLPYQPDAYLKLWSLSDPRLNADVIMFDEAQDANPVMVEIVQAQARRGKQIIWVGDSQQQIYEFTGAINALQNIATPHRTFLTKSFRFGAAVAAIANQVLSTLRDAELRIVGHDPIPSVVGPVDDPTAVLCRTNAEAVRTVLQAIAAGQRPFLVGGAGEVVAFARAAERLMRGEFADHPELNCFDSWGEVQEYVEQDAAGGDLRLLVTLIDEFGIEVILEALASLPDGKDRAAEAAADLVVSTAHKSKGREWDRVVLAGDFATDPEDGEKRLLYVAVTRAKLALDVTAVEFLQTLPAAAAILPMATAEEEAAPAPATQTSQSQTPEPGAAESPSEPLEAEDGPSVAPQAPHAADALLRARDGIIGICGKCGGTVSPDADPYDSGRCQNGSFAATHPVNAITWHRLSPAPTPDRFLEAR